MSPLHYFFQNNTQEHQQDCKAEQAQKTLTIDFALTLEAENDQPEINAIMTSLGISL